MMYTKEQLEYMYDNNISTIEKVVDANGAVNGWLYRTVIRMEGEKDDKILKVERFFTKDLQELIEEIAPAMDNSYYGGRKAWKLKLFDKDTSEETDYDPNL